MLEQGDPVQALRVVRRCAPTLPLALCSALREPRCALRAVTVDNVELCVALSLDTSVIWTIASGNNDAALWEWAIDQQISQSTLLHALRHASAALLARALRRNLRLRPLHCTLLEAMLRGCWTPLNNLSRSACGALIDALIAADLPSDQLLRIVAVCGLDPLPRHAAYLRTLISPSAPGQRGALCAALLGAELWQPQLGVGVGARQAFVRAAIRLGRLDALDWALQQPDNAPNDDAPVAPRVGRVNYGAIGWLDEAPTLEIYEALLARGVAASAAKSAQRAAHHMARWGDVPLTERMLATKSWALDDVLFWANHYGRSEVIEWLAQRASAASARAAAALEAAKAALALVAHDDYLQRAAHQGVWQMDVGTKRLAWALLRCYSQAAPDNPATRFRPEHRALAQLRFSRYTRAQRLVECDAAARWLRDPHCFWTPSWAHVWSAAPSFAWALALCDSLRGRFPAPLIAVCPKHLRRRLLERALACGLPLSAELAQQVAHAGDAPLLAWLRAQGCPWDWRCAQAAKPHGDRRMRDYLAAAEAPRRACRGAAQLVLCIEADCVQISDARHPLSDCWHVADAALHSEVGPLCCWGANVDADAAVLCAWLLKQLSAALLRRGLHCSAEAVAHAREQRARLA
jgi:hypothetical protein